MLVLERSERSLPPAVGAAVSDLQIAAQDAAWVSLAADPNEILRERFARGEITAQEFEDAKVT